MHAPDAFFSAEQETPKIGHVLLFEQPVFDHQSTGVLHRLKEEGIEGLTGVRVGKMYLFEGYSADEQTRIRTELLYEPDHTTQYTPGSLPGGSFVCVAYKPQVTNPEIQSLEYAIRRLGISTEGKKVQTASMYVLEGTITDAGKAKAESYLMNKTVQMPLPKLPDRLGVKEVEHSSVVQTIPLRSMTPDQMRELSTGRRLFLTDVEMAEIQRHYVDLGKDPTDLELETVAQTWSEHCCHKTLKAKVVMNGKEKPPMFKRLKDSTERINHPDVISCFKDNAGVVRFDDEDGVAIKFETHNAPSALEPFGGANTGLGGVIRDIMGTGLGAEPIAGSDVLLFGWPDSDDVPPGCLHPKTILREVVKGIADYGNKMGLPNISGAVLFHKGFGPKPGVLAGSIGMIPLKYAQKGEAKPGDHIICIGGKTGKDGVHGATFSSGEMTAATSEIDSTAVQIGYPVLEREVLFVLQILRERGYIHAVTDCGAGGISSAITEMGDELGADVHLDRLSMKYEGLTPWEKWISEAQERMVIAIPQEAVEEALRICRHYGINADDLGIFANRTRQLRVYENGNVAGDMSLDFLLHQNPITRIEGTHIPPEIRKEKIPSFDTAALRSLLLGVMGDLNVCSREGIIRNYDHTVSGKPLGGFYDGRKQDTPQDGMILRPKPCIDRGVMVTHGLAPEIGEHDAYQGGSTAVVEAIANAVAKGADPRKIFLVDNFMHPNPDNPVDVGTLDRSMDAIIEAAEAFGTPFVSGKDSLGMRYRKGGIEIKAPPTVVISALSILKTIEHPVPNHFTQPGSTIALVGAADAEELAGSTGARRTALSTNAVPTYDLAQQKAIFDCLHAAITNGKVLSCHDIRDGGLFTTLSEMSFGNEMGVDVTVPGAQEDAGGTLLCEKAGRFVVELPPGVDPAEAFPGLPITVLGKTSADPNVRLAMPSGEAMAFSVGELKSANRNPLMDDLFPAPRENEAPRPEPMKYPGMPAFRAASKGGAPRVLIVRAPGSNSDPELRDAFRIAGASPQIVHMADMNRARFADAQILAIPGGFSYGDDIYSGKVFAADLVKGFGEELQNWLEKDKLLLGICNGHQVLLRSGVVPFGTVGAMQANSVFNTSGRFVCRRTDLLIEDSRCVWTKALAGKRITLPVAHGEGRFHAAPDVLALMEAEKLIALRYIDENGEPTQKLPYNPNGSPHAIAGATDRTGKSLYHMPHTERHFHNFDPRVQDKELVTGLDILRQGVVHFG